MAYNSKTVLRQNVERLLQAHATIKTPPQLAKHCFWLRGKKRGKAIAPRTIAYIFEVDDDSPSPTLDVVEAVAKALNVDIWELLTDTAIAKRSFVERILNAPAVSDERLNGWSAPNSIQQQTAAYGIKNRRK